MRTLRKSILFSFADTEQFTITCSYPLFSLEKSTSWMVFESSVHLEAGKCSGRNDIPLYSNSLRTRFTKFASCPRYIADRQSSWRYYSCNGNVGIAK